MSLKDRLAIESLRNDISDVSVALGKIKNQWPGRSWKFPNQQSNDIDISHFFNKYSVTTDAEQNRGSQLSLLELLVDRLHLLILSCSQTPVESFCTIGKAGEFLVNHVNIQNQRPLSAGFVGGDSEAGSLTAYSPNYEEDVRREMFPFIQALVISIHTICNKYVIPCTSHQAWQRENRHLNKKTFIKVTSSIRADIDRIGKIFHNFDKTTQNLKARVVKEQKETKKFQLSCDSIRATLTRERTVLEEEYKSKEANLDSQRVTFDSQIETLNKDVKHLNEVLSIKSTELESAKLRCRETSKKSSEENDRRQLIESSLTQLETKFHDLTVQLKDSKLSNNKMKSKLIELSEYEVLSLKSADENSILSEQAHQNEHLISTLREEIQAERSNSKSHLSRIEYFKMQVKNGK